MRQFTTQTVQHEVLVCDRCGSQTDVRALDCKQAFTFSFRGGYGSVFEDGNLVEGDFCEQCIQETLGQHFRVTGDDPWKELSDRIEPAFAERWFYDLYERQFADAERLFGMLREAIARRRAEHEAQQRPVKPFAAGGEA